ncbi:MAG: ABC transporter permease [Pseudomonadales bacterium]|nr:ABC transporter permease [Pseudomonadales bacterium]
MRQSIGLYFTIAFRSLLQAKKRSFLLGSAIALVTMLHVLLLSISNGYLQGLVDGATSVAAGHINVTGLYKYKSTTMYPLLKDSSAVRNLIADELDDVTHVLERNSIVGKMIGEKRTIFLFLQGIDLKKEAKLKEVLTLAKESKYKKGGRAEVLGSFEALELGVENGILLFANQAEQLGVTVGDSINFQVQTLSGLNVAELRVVAVAEDVGMISSFFTFATRATVQNAMYLGENVSARILVYIEDREKAPEALEKLRRRFSQEGYEMTDYEASSLIRRWANLERQDWIGQRLDLTTWEDNISEAKIVVNSFTSISYVLVTILSVIIAVGILNTCWISVKDRTNEIGCIRAIGMSSRGILVLFMLEALLLGFFWAVVGAGAGYLIVELISLAEIPIDNEAIRIVLFSTKLTLDIGIIDLVEAVLFFSLVTGISALFPSIRAARIQPIQAINHIA